MISLWSQLATVQVGNIVHGTYPNDGSAICLVCEVTDEAIITRAFTTQYSFIFNRQTGITTRPDGTEVCHLDSVAQLPREIHSAILDIDRKYRSRDSREGDKLQRHEIDALLFVADYYPAHPLNREPGAF